MMARDTTIGDVEYDEHNNNKENAADNITIQGSI